VSSPAAEVSVPEHRARSLTRSDARRRLATLRIFQRALGQCWGARACLWLSRLVGVSFVLAALYVSGLAPATSDAILRMALIALSACAELAAFSAAGRAPDRILEAGRGLLETRALSLQLPNGARPLAVALWILRHVGFAALIVAMACVGLASEPRQAAHALALAAGAASYVVLLAGGLALLAQLCHVLGRTRGQALFLGLVLLPPLLSPAWPELPTVAAGYQRLLDRCLDVEVKS
jgi:hypothetical protein